MTLIGWLWPGEVDMTIWKMESNDLTNVQWQVSKYQGEVIVRAESEELARDLLGYVFWKPGQSGSANMAGPPWNRPNLVMASEVTQSEFPDQGDDEILAPPEAVILWKEYQV